MSECQQAENWSIADHGEDVWKHTKKLILGNFDGFILPKWFIENHHFIVNSLYSWDTIKRYNKFHDCGKPFCVLEDPDGRKHFSNHAEVSKQIFLDTFPDELLIADLIGLDMLLHTCSLVEIESLDLPSPILMTLLITAFGELHSNAKMFGGTDSISFKIKYKKLDKIGKRLVQSIPKHDDTHAYVFVRNNLSPAQSIVQACHAVYEGARYQHPSLVVLSVKSEHKLQKAMELLMDNNIQFYIFKEPDLDNTITAVVTEPLVGQRREVLKNYMLWSGK